jgi:integrase
MLDVKGEEIPHWYLLKLIEYKRISVNIEVLMRMRIRREDALLGNSKLINLNFIEQFEEKGIESMKYSKVRVKKSVTIALIRALLYYQIPIEDFIGKAKEYIELIENKVSGNHKRNILNAINILIQMGYEVSYSFNKEPKLTITGDLLVNPHKEIRESIEEYVKNLQSEKSIKSLRTVSSHLRTFFNFLYQEYPEVDQLSKLTNKHIEEFISNQKNLKNFMSKTNTSATINNRIYVIKQMLEFFRRRNKYNIPNNIISRYDTLKEPKTYTKSTSQSEILKLIKAIQSVDTHGKFMQHKMALIILIDTGRRIHEVLSLELNCLRNGKVYFHKTKNNNPGWQIVGEATINAIRILKEYANNIKSPLYSYLDGKIKRRLFPSKYRKGISILSIDAVTDFFNKIQIENNIVDDNSKPKYSLHDNKRNFVSCMLEAGVEPQEISSFLKQNVNSLVPYEVNNQKAIETLKKIEQKGLLIGNSYHKEIKKYDNPITKLLEDIDVVTRNKNNLIFKINNTKETMPLALGNCTDNSNFEICGDLVCLACDEFKTDSLKDFRKYAIKMYKYIYTYKRNNRVKKIEEKLNKALRKVYVKLNLNGNKTFQDEIKEIKKIARRENKKDEKH